MTEDEFNERFIARVKAFRERRGWSQKRMAEMLGVTLDRYKKYETRSPLPIALIEQFAAYVGEDVETVITGRRPEKR